MANQSGGYIVTVSLIAAAILWLVTGSEPLEPGPINISRGDYVSALAKWNRLRVEKYEEVFRDFAGCKFKVVVEVDRTSGKAVENIKHAEELGCPAPYDPKWKYIPAADELTIGALFQELGEHLHDIEHCTQAYPQWNTYSLIRFDHILGYPRFIGISGESFDENYAHEVIVESVKVLK